MLPKIAGLIRRAKQKGNQQKLDKTRQASKCSLKDPKTVSGLKIISKVRKGEITNLGPAYNCRGESDFQTKLTSFIYCSDEVMKVDAEINKSIDAAMEGQEPGLVIQLEDDKLTIECFQ